MNSLIKDTPASIVENGRIHSGFFKLPFRNVNLLDAPNMGGPIGRPLRWFRLKEWVGFGINHPKLFGAIFIQDAKYAASGTVYLFDRESLQKYEWPVIDLPGRARVPGTLWNDRGYCGFGGNKLIFDHNLSMSRHRVQAHFKAIGKRPSLDADLVFHQDLKTTDPLVVSLPIHPDHHTYTHKSPLHIEGVVRIGKNEYLFDPKRDLGNLDEQKTFYPYRSRWHWGSFAGFSAEGREIMINFVDQMTEKGKPGEDAMWVDGRLLLMDPVEFIPGTDAGRFRLEDKNGRVRLRFTAAGSKVEKHQFFVASMDYEQFFGCYDGFVEDDRGVTHSISGVFGALERMKARF